MAVAVRAFLLSAVIGITFAFFEPGMGIIMAISIIGSILIYQNEKKK